MRPQVATNLFGEAVRARRSRLGLSQRELAKRCGVAQTTIAGIECGHHSTSVSFLPTLAEGLETSAAKLVAVFVVKGASKAVAKTATKPVTKPAAKKK